jgi:DNA-binding NarL/FixJ family response regulator
MKSTTARYKVIIADDHQFFRDGFEIALKQIDQVKKVTHAANGKRCLKF